GHGETVERTEDFAPAFERASASGKPAIIELKIDPEAISPATTLSAIRAKERKAQSGEGDELRVVLVGALELEEIVVAAALAVRVFAAHPGTRVVNRA